MYHRSGDKVGVGRRRNGHVTCGWSTELLEECVWVLVESQACGSVLSMGCSVVPRVFPRCSGPLPHGVCGPVFSPSHSAGKRPKPGLEAVLSGVLLPASWKTPKCLVLASVSMVVSPIRLNKIGIKEQDLEFRVWASQVKVLLAGWLG